MSNTQPEFLNAKAVRARYSISEATLWRWERDPEVGLPKPVMIAKRRYWRLADIVAFERQQQKAG